MSFLDGLILRTLHALDRLETAVVVPARARSEVEGRGTVVLGRYEVERLLGQGGMGRVWLANDRVEGRAVALKELRSDVAAGALSDLAFQREFFTLTRLRHPNVVEVFDYGPMPSGHRFIALEYVEGRDLSALLRRGPLETQKAIEVLAALCEALGFIHSRLFVHCDIKPENVRLTGRGALKLMDFGLLHPLGTAAGQSIKGTPFYIAPEVVRGGVIDGRTDLYSLGVLAFQLLTGQLPFRARSIAELLRQHLEAPAPRVGELRRVPPAMEQLVAGLLAKAPDQRPADAAAVSRALGALAGRSPAPVSYSVRASYLQSAELIGREAERATLVRALEALRAGAGGAVFVSAPAGAGKSRLLHETRLAAKMSDLTYLVGHCRPERLAPLAPFVEALSPLMAASPPAQPRALAALFPRLATEGGGDAAPANKQQLFGEIQAWISTVGDREPLVLCLEDLHWADHSTVELLNALIRALAGKRVLLLGTFRSDEVDRLSPLYHTVDDNLTLHMQLEGLTPSATAELVANTLKGARLPQALVERIYQTARGNPFAVTEMLRLLIEREVVQLRAGNWEVDATRPLELPPTLERVIVERLASLSAQTRAVADAMSAVGRQVDLELAATLCALDPRTLFAEVEGLVERQYLVSVDKNLYFTHETVRAALYAQLPEERRRSLHQRIAEHIETGSRGREKAAAAVLGYHYSRGSDSLRASKYLLLAGQQALASQLLREATTLLSQGADLLERQQDARRATELQGVWSRLVEIGLHEHPQTCSRYAEKLVPALGTKVSSACIQRFNRVTARLSRRRDGLSRWYLRRLWQPRPFDPRERRALKLVPHYFVVRSMHAYACAVQGDPAGAKRIVDQLLVENPSPGAFRAAAQVSRAPGLFHHGQYAPLLAAAQEAQGWFEEHLARVGPMPPRLHWSYVSSLYWQLTAAAAMGRPLDDALLRRAEALAASHGFRDWQLFLKIAALMRAGKVGEPEALQRLFGDLGDTLRALGFPRMIEMRVVGCTVVFHLHRREWEHCEAAVARFERLLKAVDDPNMKRLGLTYRAILSVERQAATAEEDLGSALEAISSLPGFFMAGDLMYARARRALSTGAREEAARYGQQLLERGQTAATANPWDEVLALRILGETQGGVDGARWLEQAARVAEQNGLTLHAALARMARARALLHVDRSASAVDVAAAESTFKDYRCAEWLTASSEFRFDSARR